MSNSLQPVQKGGLPKSSDINQVIGFLNGTVDIGYVQLPGPTNPPSSAPTVATNGIAGSGNINNTEWYAVTFVTGVMASNGVMQVTGETPIGPVSSAVTAQNQSILLSNIPVGPSTVIARRIYRSPALPNPSSALNLSTVSNSSSTLAATTYYVNYALMNSQGTTTPGSSEASITISTANAYAITFSVTLPNGATGILVGMGTSSGGEGQYAQISSSGTVTYVGGNSAGVSASVSGSTLTVTITKPPSSTSTAMPSSNTANTNNYRLVATISDNVTTTYLDNIPDASLGQTAPTTNTTGSYWVYPNLTSFPSTAVVGQIAMVSGAMYFYDGTQWNQLAPSWQQLIQAAFILM
ncbi:hypothetical protein [Alicyclobacillus vulcanalis]|uniref:Uncharacterized protein n=1 Tax=Alicyclobacillus vulcanalis TaxID=252246 RepID=A0A1N7MQ93_9BACL|nr:hypothetical protein [Alicyclobacillus vulcanalis]SIS88222.1 hypothetical protein SAMN05421799_10623 [Alicyclobacillus vulcanalis]